MKRKHCCFLFDQSSYFVTKIHFSTFTSHKQTQEVCFYQEKIEKKGILKKNSPIHSPLLAYPSHFLLKISLSLPSIQELRKKNKKPKKNSQCSDCQESLNGIKRQNRSRIRDAIVSSDFQVQVRQDLGTTLRIMPRRTIRSKNSPNKESRQSNYQMSDYLRSGLLKKAFGEHGGDPILYAPPSPSLPMVRDGVNAMQS